MTKHYWEYGEQSQVKRREYNTGDIFENAATCHKCGDYIRSNNRHDFKYCSCGNIGVDGGSWYAKRIGPGVNDGSYTDKIVSYLDVREKTG